MRNQFDVSWGSPSARLSLVFVALLLALAALATPAFAQDQYDCASFGSQESAQAELERDPSDPSNLDADNDGIACEDYDYGTTETSPQETEESGDLDCADFATQDEAQAEYNADPSDPNGLDADDDGIACEELSGAAGTEDAAGNDDTAEADAFRCELLLRVVRDGGDAGRHQYFDGSFADDDLLVRRVEECREREVLKGTIPGGKLPDTGGPPLLVAAWGIALVGAGIVLLRRP